MSTHFDQVRNFVTELGYPIDRELPDQEVVVISDEESGINNLIIDCEGDIVILEQFILKLPGDSSDVLKRLLQINRELVHGALVLDDAGEKVIFRDTLQLENLDMNELEASIKSVSLMLGEHADELIRFARGN